MQYAPVINALHAALGNTARVVTRYNSPANDSSAIQRMLEKPEAVIESRTTKFVVADLGDVSFHLSITQIGEGTRTIDPHAWLGNQRTYSTHNFLHNALAMSGLSNVYTDALKFIMASITSQVEGEVFFGADSNPFSQSVTIYARQDNVLLAFQFQE